MKVANKSESFKAVNKQVDFGKIYSIKKLFFKNFIEGEFWYSPDGVKWFKNSLPINEEVDFNDKTARFIKADNNFEVSFELGDGYVGTLDSKWTSLFSRKEYWTGGDGLFTFNLKDGVEKTNMKDEEVRTLCVFGDTLVGTASPITNERLDPLCMINSSYALIDGAHPDPDKTKFMIKQDELGRAISILNPTTCAAYKGTMAANLVSEGLASHNTPWLSSKSPKNIELLFDLNKEYEIDHIDVYNFFINSERDLHYQNRGLKEIKIYTSNNNQTFELLGSYTLDKADFNLAGNNFTRIDVNKTHRYFKIVVDPTVGIGNYGGVTGSESLFGLNKVRFFEPDGNFLKDITCTSTTEYFRESKNSWFWLQDGVIINGYLYLFPLIVVSDLTQVEGFQFAIDGISMLKVPVRNGQVFFNEVIQKDTNLYNKVDGREWYWGAGIFSNTAEAGAPDPDGYIYIYGYTSKFEEIDYGRRMRVARVKPEDFDNINEWRYFDGVNWVKDMFAAIPILDHVSCELSVSFDDGKYICVFTYDVQSRYLSYAISDTPYGPFSEPNIAYVAPEKGGNIYCYNAKAHPHLSTDEGILASYNVNTSIWEENRLDANIYAPRFVRLKKTKRIGG